MFPALVLGAWLIACTEKERRPTTEASDSTEAWRVVQWGNPDQAETRGSKTADPDRSPPTIVLMISDDQHYQDFGFGENPAAVTPHIDRMAREGALFRVAHVGMSRCRPSLACLLSGMYPHQNGVYYNFAEVNLDPTLDTLPRQLGRAGFACWAGGKYWEGDPRRLGFSHRRGGTSVSFVREGQASVADFLDRTRNQPVFLWWAPRMPHIPHNAPPRMLERIDPEKIEQPDYVPDERWPQWKARKHQLLAMGAWLDEGVGELFGLLENHDRLDNALLVFLVDNGFEFHAPAKGTVYERGFRTPVILWGPDRIEAGMRTDRLISSLDILPTILEWAGAETPDHFEGRSLWPLLENAETEWRDRLFGADYPRTASSAESPRAAQDVQALYVRTERYKYVAFVRDIPKGTDAAMGYYTNPETQEEIRTGDQMLFDLRNDPEELHNLAADPAVEAELKNYRHQVFQWWSDTGGGPLPLGPEDF